MIHMPSYISLLVVVVASTWVIQVMADEAACDQTKNINYITYDVFDLTDEKSIFLHHWANFLHIKTKQKTLINESAFFLERCQLSNDDLLEIERHFRGQKFIRDASVAFGEDGKIDLATWDNWTLMPTADFGRKGGENKFAFGIKDSNLLGLGVDAEIEYFSDDQRSGYKFKTKFPLYLRNNITASIRLADNDDGSSTAVLLEKDFVSFNTQNAYQIGFENFEQIDTQYKDGLEATQFFHNKQFSTIKWRWLYANSEKDLLRLGVGFTNDKHTFSNVFGSNFSIIDYPLPADREFNYPFFTVEYLQKDYRKLTNLNLIDQIEDFNLGWNGTLKIGTDIGSQHNSPILLWQSYLSKGIAVNDNTFWFFNARYEGETYNRGKFKNRSSLTLDVEYFHKFNLNWAGYFNNETQWSKNQYLDTPMVLGGESGLRGFPLQYQHGESSTRFTLEARYYPHINIYKLLELGGAAFIDVGRVFNQTEPAPNPAQWLSSIGIGARLYSSHSSEARVIHFDIIKPITSSLNVNSVEFRITTKHSF